jgi:MFS family permease
MSIVSDTPPAILSPHLTVSSTAPSSRHAIAAAVIGNALEFYDFTTYAFFAVMIGKAFFPAQDSWISLLLSVATFGVGFVTRPLGGIFIGAYADRAGRKPAMLLTIGLMAIGMLMIALAPGYASIGIAAPGLVVLGRMIQGFALGGEVGPSTAFLLESAPSDKRGLFGSWQLASQGAATLVAGMIGVVLSLALTTAQMESWGWRLPFLLGLVIVPVGLYIRNNLPETAGNSTGNAEATTSAVFKRLLKSHLGLLLLVITAGMCGTVTTYITNYMTTYAITTLHLSASLSIAATAVVGICVLVFSLVGGWLSDRIGRRPLLIVPRALLLVIAYPAFLLMIRQPGAVTLLSMSGLIAALGSLSAAPDLVAITELFPRAIRSAAVSVAYAFIVTVFGGTTQLVVTYLIGVTGDPLSPAYYLIATSVVGVIAMFAFPETSARALD